MVNDSCSSFVRDVVVETCTHPGAGYPTGNKVCCGEAETGIDNLKRIELLVQFKNVILPITLSAVCRAAGGVEIRYPQRMPVRFPTSGDQKLVQIVDAALADATQRSGAWLACRPGCTQCCVGVFAINQLDALRLKRGLAKLEKLSRRRADEVRRRARQSLSRLSADFPGDRTTGVLDESEDAAEAFEQFGNDEPCPALEPETGLCELYEHRPMTCRVFGPPVRSEEGLGVCELCFNGATEDEIAACEMIPDPDDLESDLLEQLEKSSGRGGDTIIAFVLAS